VLTAPYDGKPALWRRRRTLPSRFQEVRKMDVFLFLSRPLSLLI